MLIPGLDFLAPDLSILVVGPPGCGKSAAVADWAAKHDRELLVEHPVIADAVDYRGLPVAREGYAEWLPIGTLRRVTEPSCRAVLFLDDLGQATASVQAAAMQLVLARRLGDAALAPDVLVAAATNRVSDRSGVRPMLAALVNRMMVVTVTPDATAWSAWALQQPDLSPLVAGYARFRADAFAPELPAEPMTPYCTPRSLAMAGRLLMRGAKTLSLLAGCIGAAAAADLLAYIDAAASLPSLDDMFSPFFRPPVKDPGLCHAIVVLAARAAAERPDDVVALAERWKGGWGTALISSAVDVSARLKSHAAFRRWAVAHKSLL